MATFLPSSFRAINIPPVDVGCLGREIDRTKCYEAQRTIGCKARGISAFAFGRDAVCLRGNFELFDLLLNFVGESRRACAIYDAMVKRER